MAAVSITVPPSSCMRFSMSRTTGVVDAPNWLVPTPMTGIFSPVDGIALVISGSDALGREQVVWKRRAGAGEQAGLDHQATGETRRLEA